LDVGMGVSATLSINAKTVEGLSDRSVGNSGSTGRSPFSVSGVRCEQLAFSL
jgi:hypothetical protein